MKTLHNALPSRLQIFALFLLALWLSLHATNARAADTKSMTNADNITIETPEARSTAPGQKVTGAFMLLKNNSTTDIDLTAANATAANVTEIHKSSMKDGMMQMEQVEKITVPANGSAELKPGSFHIMLIDLKNTLTSGEKTSITLTFADGSQTTVEAVIVDVGN
jgi:hypothetical protein